MQALKKTLAAHEKKLCDAWFERMLSAYPEASRVYLERINNQFTNPVGANLYHSLEELLKELLKEESDAERVQEELQLIMRIKGVQEVLPSQAVSFVPALKQIINRECQSELKNGTLELKELMDFYEELDTVALWAFDLYSESKTLIYELRLAQIKETNDILVRANLLDQALDVSDFMQCASSAGTEGFSCNSSCSGCGVPATEPSDSGKGV